LNRIIVVIFFILNCTFTGGKLINFENEGRIRYFKKIEKPKECVGKVEKYIVDSLVKKPIYNIRYYEVNTVEKAIYFIANDTKSSIAGNEFLAIIDSNCELLYVFNCKYKKNDLIDYW